MLVNGASAAATGGVAVGLVVLELGEDGGRDGDVVSGQRCGEVLDGGVLPDAGAGNGEEQLVGVLGLAAGGAEGGRAAGGRAAGRWVRSGAGLDLAGGPS